MKYEEFTIKNNKMLYWRLGNMNSNKQEHWGSEHHQPPAKRGIWCFPYPHYDLFFCYHQWEKYLPKKFRDLGQIGMGKKESSGIKQKDEFFKKASQEEIDSFFKEEEMLMKKIRKEHPPTKFWYDGNFYSHISINNEVNYDSWFFWDNAKEWVKLAMKNLYVTEKWDGILSRMSYADDHLEIFIPNY